MLQLHLKACHDRILVDVKALMRNQPVAVNGDMLFDEGERRFGWNQSRHKPVERVKPEARGDIAIMEQYKREVEVAA